MGKRGPKPTPTAILEQRGSWRAKIRPDEPQAGRGVPPMPPGLGAEAKRVWHRLAPALDEMGVMTTNDGDILGRYCVLLVLWRKAMTLLQREGTVYETRTDAGHPVFKQRPQVAIARALGADLIKIEDRFGLSPSARAGLSVAAIFQNAKRQASPDDKPPVPGGPAPTVIQGKDRFFGGKPA